MLDTIRRRGRLQRTAVAAALATLTIAAAPAHARAPIETVMQDDAAFLHRSDEGVREAMLRAKSLGVDRLRLTAGWSVLAPDPDSAQRPDFDARDPNAYPTSNWRNLDRAVRTARDVGLDVMIDIAFWAPLWATQGDPNEGRARWNIDPDAYTDFALAVVKRYSGEFTPEAADPNEPPPPPSQDRTLIEEFFAGWDSGGQQEQAEPAPEPTPEPLPAVRWWTIWNEPNHQGFVQPQWEQRGGRWVPRSPHIYRKMVERSYPAIKGLMPDSVVLVGGTSSTGASRPTSATMNVSPLRFVRELACVDERYRPLTTPECRDYRPLQGDGFSHHPYSLLQRPNHRDRNPDNLKIGDLERLTRALDRLVRMRRIDPKIRDLYLTEYGYETNPPDPIKPFNPEQAARFINWAEYLAWKHPTVKTWPQFLLDDLGGEHYRRPFGDWQSGLFWVDGTPKPSATSFKYALFAECVPARAASSRSRRSRGRRPARSRTAVSSRSRGRARSRRRARRAQAPTVLIWGHVRPGSGPRDVRLVSSVRGGGWQPAATAARRSRGRQVRNASATPFTTDAGGTFVRYAPYVRGTTYRLETASGEQGLPVTPAGCGRRAR